MLYTTFLKNSVQIYYLKSTSDEHLPRTNKQRITISVEIFEKVDRGIISTEYVNFGISWRIKESLYKLKRKN